MKTVYVVLYQDLWLKTCKVSQQGYKTLEEAQTFCKNSLGVPEHPNNPALYQQFCGHVFGNGATQEKYTIVEVTI